MIIKKVLAFERDLRRKIIKEEENKNRILGHDQEDSSPLPIGRSRMHIWIYSTTVKIKPLKNVSYNLPDVLRDLKTNLKSFISIKLRTVAWICEFDLKKEHV